MITSNKIINVEGIKGTYIRKEYTRDMFKEVTTQYNLNTKNLEKYLSRKVYNAKDITRVFKNLEKEGYTITTVKTVTPLKSECFNTEIGGIFNGNIRTINILWIPTLAEKGFKQRVLTVIS